tara:strand:- start:4908 stop:5324 length:417 start_codon:yes stop_codon:yes gene_type:complete
MPYKDRNSPEAKASYARAQEKYRKTDKGKEVRNGHLKKWLDKPDNKERVRLYQKEYRKTPQCKKSNMISHWKGRGLKESPDYTYSSLYDIYLIHSNCELCNVVLTTGTRTNRTKCMDHDHETGLFRNILCMDCNLRRG